MGVIGYARVSTHEQDPALQIDALRAAGVVDIRHEHRGGAADRPVLEAVLLGLSPGDVLLVYKVDRLARSLADLLRVLGVVADRGAQFRSLTEPIDTTSAAGRMLVQLLGAFAEFERAIIRERCHAGRVAARSRGVEFGRPRLLLGPELAEVAAQGLSQKECALALGVSRSAVRRCALREGIAFLRDGRRAHRVGA